MRTCVLLMPGLSGRLFDALPLGSTPGWVGELIALGRATIRPVVPAVTMPVQATYTTGVTPAEHGVVANGFATYRDRRLHEHLDLSSFAEFRRNVSFWEQSTKLLTAPRVWSRSQRRTAMLFVQSSIGAADVVVTPKPTHTPDGRTISTCGSEPSGLYPSLKSELGEFPLHHYWGPMAGIKGSEWIAAAARIVWEREPCDLQWTYIPQLDYDLQRFGPDDERCVQSLVQVLGLLTPLAEKVMADGGRVVVAAEYGMTRVSHSIAPNVMLREAGLLRVTGGGAVDYGSSDAFAMCDHQVAHVYCPDPRALDRVKEVFHGVEGIERCLQGGERSAVSLDTDRAGEIVLFTRPDAWFEYRWWEDWSQAPEYAWKVDIHRKPGYDPTELFFDPAKRRIRADEPRLVQGSHGALLSNPRDWPLLLGVQTGEPVIDATRVAGLV